MKTESPPLTRFLAVTGGVTVHPLTPEVTQQVIPIKSISQQEETKIYYAKNHTKIGQNRGRSQPMLSLKLNYSQDVEEILLREMSEKETSIVRL